VESCRAPRGGVESIRTDGATCRTFFDLPADARVGTSNLGDKLPPACHSKRIVNGTDGHHGRGVIWFGRNFSATNRPITLIQI
jgi:hypothetical protein